MSLEKVNCPICKDEMIRIKRKQDIEINLDEVKELPPRVRAPVTVYVCLKCHNMQMFLDWQKQA